MNIVFLQLQLVDLTVLSKNWFNLFYTVINIVEKFPYLLLLRIQF